MVQKLAIIFIASVVWLNYLSASDSLYYDHVLDADGSDYIADLDLNPVTIRNRAACAAASSSPADSAFTIVNAELVGQTAYRIYQNTDKKISEDYYKVYAVKEFRLRLARLSNQIHSLLLTGKLPLIPSSNEKLSRFPKLKSVFEACPDLNCLEVDNYIAHVGSYFVNNVAESLGQIDSELENERLIFSLNENNNRCFYLKKFSPLQANLFASSPSVDLLNAIGEAYEKQQSLVTECIDPSPNLSNAYYAFQNDFKITDTKKFEEYGFEYWSSFKLYLQAWWRLDYVIPIITEKDQSVKLDWFRDLDLASILMITPNSCKSIEKPQCDNTFLAINSLRKLSAFDQRFFYRIPGQSESRHQSDHSEAFPNGPQYELVSDKKPSVNTDINNIRSYGGDSRDWIKNFYVNLSKRKAILNSRLWEAVNIYNLFL
ncbi:MAG: hypothetical protein KDD37_02710, partial [Bdellovibrionales bacterium]|nr:hypothetical protein [Bdellovibrionales bacterium]